MDIQRCAGGLTFDGYVDIAETEFAHKRGIFFLIDREIHIGVCVTEMVNEVRYQVRGYCRKYSYPQTTRHSTCLVRYKFLYSLRFVQGYLCLTYYL